MGYNNDYTGGIPVFLLEKNFAPQEEIKLKCLFAF